MGKHTLILLNHWHDEDGTGPFYCPDCATAEGFLRYAPEVEKQIQILKVDFPRPRKEIIDLIGETNQESPVLILDESASVPSSAKRSLETGKAFISDISDICDYLGREFNCVRPHP